MRRCGGRCKAALHLTGLEGGPAAEGVVVHGYGSMHEGVGDAGGAAGEMVAVGNEGIAGLLRSRTNDAYDYTGVHWTLVPVRMGRDGHAESSKERPARRRMTADTLRGPWCALPDA